MVSVGWRHGGFFHGELYSLIVLSRDAFSEILPFLALNGVTDMRNDLPGSSSNETYHALLRLFSKNLRIGSTLAHVVQLVAVAAILSDQARSMEAK